MRIIFVGLHNKPGKIPLCGSTKSGKLINRIISEGHFKNAIKTNLYDVEYWPMQTDERVELEMNFLDRVQPTKTDLLIFLGAATHDRIPPHSSLEIKIAHPASKRSHIDMHQYVATTIDKIREILKKELTNTINQ
jgi:hypothetical protein